MRRLALLMVVFLSYACADTPTGPDGLDRGLATDGVPLGGLMNSSGDTLYWVGDTLTVVSGSDTYRLFLGRLR